MEHRVFGLLMGSALLCTGCSPKDFEASVHYEFRAAVSDEGSVLGYALVIDAASWERLLQAHGRSRALIQQDTHRALSGFIQADLETVHGCAGLSWHYSRSRRLADGSLRFELQCGGGWAGGPLVNIKNTEATAALNEWSRQSNQQLLFDASIVRGRHTSSVMGIPVEALKAMLKGTGLVVSDGPDDRTWTITAAGSRLRNGI